MRATSFDGVTIAFDADGSGDPSLVFVHGWSCDRTYWRHQIPYFSEHYRTVAVDLAGHGESGTSRVDYTMTSFGRDLVAVADALDLESAVLVGHSMGGDVVTAAAPLLGARAAGVVWVDTYRSLGEPRPVGHVDGILASLRMDPPAGVRALIGPMFTEQTDPTLREWILDDMGSAPPHIALSAIEHAVTFEPELIAALEQIDAPVVAINPDGKPTDTASLAEHGITTVLLSDVGHFAMLEDPDQFNRVLDATIRRLSSPRRAKRGGPPPRT